MPVALARRRWLLGTEVGFATAGPVGAGVGMLLGLGGFLIGKMVH